MKPTTRQAMRGVQLRLVAPYAERSADELSRPDESEFREVYCRTQTAYKAAEFLVASDLSFAGNLCTIAAEGLPYDILADSDSGLFRIQVKSTAKPKQKVGRPNQWRYHFKLAKTGKPIMQMEQVDWYAFVALDRRRIVYRSVHDISGAQVWIQNHEFKAGMRPPFPNTQ